MRTSKLIGTAYAGPGPAGQGRPRYADGFKIKGALTWLYPVPVCRPLLLHWASGPVRKRAKPPTGHLCVRPSPPGAPAAARQSRLRWLDVSAATAASESNNGVDSYPAVFIHRDLATSLVATSAGPCAAPPLPPTRKLRRDCCPHARCRRVRPSIAQPGVVGWWHRCSASGLQGPGPSPRKRGGLFPTPAATRDAAVKLFPDPFYSHGPQRPRYRLETS